MKYDLTNFPAKMKTIRLKGFSTPNDLEPFEKGEPLKVIMEAETGVFLEKIVLYPAYVIANNLDDVLKDIDDIKNNRYEI